ncbi:hypothetical protein OAU81_00840 [bacterium]|nr:hypothetical protein [bacterium]
MACNDFNNDGILDIDDVYILFAYTQILSRPAFLRPNPIEVSHVQAEYDKLFPGRGATVVFSPAEAYIRPNGNLYVDYTDDGVIDIDDVYIYFAYTQISSRPVFLRPNPIEVSHVQAEYDKLFPGRGATVVYIPELVCVTPTPTPTPTPTHCYNHPDYVLNYTQNTFHCSIQGAIDMADDDDVLHLTTGVDYESPVNIQSTSPKRLTIEGNGNLVTGGSITVQDNALILNNINLSGDNLILNNTLSTTEIRDCTFDQSQVVANVVDELLLHNNTFVNPCVLSTDWAISVHAVNTQSYTELYNNNITIPAAGNGIHLTANTQSYCKLDMNTLNNCEVSIMLTRQDFTIENNIITTPHSGVIIDYPPVGTSGTIRQNVLNIDTDVLTIQNNSKPYRVDASYNYIQGFSSNWLIKDKSVTVDASPRYTNDSKTSLVN